MNSKVVDTPLGSIEYSMMGKGRPIVFIHGGHSNSQETLSHKGFDLNKYQLITPSRPGYGRTPLSKHQSPVQAAQLIAALIDQLEIDQVIVYGISAGGLTAIALAATHPDKVSKLVLASAVSKKWLDKQDDIYKTAQKLFHPKVERFIWGMIRMVTYIFPGMIAQSFYPQFSTQPMGKLSRQSIHELIDALRKYRSKEGFLNDIDQQLDDDLITKIKSPTLIIHSTYDNSVALEHAEYAHHMILHSSLEVLQNEWGHLFWIGSDSPQSINKTIHFLEDNQV